MTTQHVLLECMQMAASDIIGLDCCRIILKVIRHIRGIQLISPKKWHDYKAINYDIVVLKRALVIMLIIERTILGKQQFEGPVTQTITHIQRTTNEEFWPVRCDSLGVRLNSLIIWRERRVNVIHLLRASTFAHISLFPACSKMWAFFHVWM